MERIMNGKTCLITGANSGIGKALALAISNLGANVIMLCRNRNRGELAINEISRISNNPNIDLLLVDLSSQKSIRDGVDEFRNKHNRLDVLINNAGVLLFERILTEDGIESTFAINYLGHFLLTNMLLDLLKSSGPSRIINVSSEAQTKGRINFDDLMGKNKYSPLTAYSQAKLANILFTCELASRLDRKIVTVNCFYPTGVVKTNLGNTDKGIFKYTYRIFRALLNPLFISPTNAAEIGVYLATSEDVVDISGRYFVKKKNELLANELIDGYISGKLWEVSVKLSGLNKE